jgi:hypothetical protein
VPNSTTGSPFTELLRIVREHVEKTGHRSFYTMREKSLSGRAGYGCNVCDQQGDCTFEVHIDYVGLTTDPRAMAFMSSENSDPFLEWLAAIPSPMDEIREVRHNAWEHLLGEDE